VRLSLVPGGGDVEIRTADGMFTGPEHVVEIHASMMSTA
jgi:hypothetical protein